jgi:hypothetical protein
MIVLAFKYIPYTPPYTPSKDMEEEWFSKPLEVFELAGYPDMRFPNKPCHAVYFGWSERLVGYYCAKTDTHILCLRRFMELLRIRD